MKKILLIALVACSSAEVGSRSSTLTEPSRLIAIEETPATVGDQAPRTRVGFLDGEGNITPLDEPALAFVDRFQDGAAFVDAQRRLYQVWPFERRMLAANVTALAGDGNRIVYVVETREGLSIRLHDGSGERELSRGLVSAGVFKFEAERILFVGASNGGVAGVWQVSLLGSEAHCVTNCDLRTGEPWGGRFVPPPTLPALLEAP